MHGSWMRQKASIIYQAFLIHIDIFGEKHSVTSIPNNQYQATASQVFVDCWEKCVKKSDKNSVITINIYTNVKFKILVFMRV